jgi:hypothetical protein
MEQSLIEKWTKALRSGDYEQGKKTLRNRGFHDRHSSLGVLVDILKTEKREYPGVLWDAVFLGSEIPGDIRKDIGLSDDSQQDLIYMNDEIGYNFIEIANWIEVNPEHFII